ncbi:prolyl oligopeptidase family serine peptidase [Nonomuraea sp. NPDC049784]|uniref:alpha/beta hydrolase family protein n=1 Tax=Nonomuraea sp. NPDC049784 TaxID=3154361 RepID=UPI0033E33166
MKELHYASTDTADLLLDLYIPDVLDPAGVPAVLYLHGGGWLIGTRADHSELAGVPESELTEEHLCALSPITHVHPGSPPMLLLHGTSDAITTAQQSQWLAETVRAVGGQARTMLLDGANHEDSAFDEDETIAAVARFFTTHL